MKLSFKFFCIAYIIVLLSAGIPSAFFIEASAKNEWQAREEQAISDTVYAAHSFLSLTELSSGEISKKRLQSMTVKISRLLDRNPDSFSIVKSENRERLPDTNHYTKRQEYTAEDGKTLFLSSATVVYGDEAFEISCITDFSDLSKSHRKMRGYYSLTVFAVALVGGALLFIAAQKITRPLKKLTEAANEIKNGNYGKSVILPRADEEIRELAESFNAMSAATEQALGEIKDEVARRERFIADFTHEMKTPMTAIIGYAQLLDTYELTEKEKRAAARAISREGKRLEDLSYRLLELFVAQNEEVEFEEISLKIIEKRIAETMAFSAIKRGCKLTLKLPDIKVRVNLSLILSLFYNLLDNALKALEQNGEISVTGVPLEGRILITVKDNGRGISKENIGRLTEPFFREDKARSRKLGGAGIGLALSKEIAAIHGTSLTFESSLGEGTVVTFELWRVEK